MRYIFIGLIVLTFSFSQTPVINPENNTGIKFGAELDALPYITGGYYGSVWLGLEKQSLRIRPIVAKVNIPSFFLDDKYEKNTLKVYALVLDYFIEDNFEGIWLASGFEYWDATIKNKAGISADYNEYIFTVGGGYVWKFWGNLYINPWVAGHFHLAGDKEVQTGADVFKPAFFTPEFSLKVGLEL